MHLWCLIALTAADATPGDPTRALVHQVVRNYEVSQKQLGDFLFDRRVRNRKLDAAGQVREESSVVVRRELIDEIAITRAIERNGRPLPSSEQAEQEKRIDKALAEYRKLSPADRDKRRQSASVTNNREMEFLREMPEAMDYQYLGSEFVEGREVLQFSMKPRSGYKPKGLAAKVFANVEGKLWIDKQAAEMVRLDAVVTNDTTVGGILAKVEKGTEFHIARKPVESVYLPHRLRIRFGTTVLMVKSIRQETESDYVDYRRWRRAAGN